MAGRLIAKRLADKTFPSNLRGVATISAFQSKSLSTAAVPVQDNEKKDIEETPRRRRRSPAIRRRTDFAPFGSSDIWDPFPANRTLTQMMDSVNRLFDGFLPSRTDGDVVENFRVPYDIMEDEKSYKLRFDMPGLGKEEVKVGIEDGTLVITGEHSEESQKDNWTSRSHGSYNTRIILPDNVHLEETKAEMKNGVLQVFVPKVEEAKSQSLIDVKVE